MRAATFATSLVAVSLLAGCPQREVAKVDPTQTKEGFKDIPVEINRDIDILFVIDNSGSMQEEQTSLATNFNRFINVLENIEGGLPNVHIGVVSTDMGAGPFGNSIGCGTPDNGELQNAPQAACEPPSGRYIEDIGLADGSRQRNYTGTLEDTFSCIARLGTDGCGFEQQLESMRRALNGSNPNNTGFLRPDAFLAVVFITDEDDCSTEDTTMFDTSQTTVSDPLGPLDSFRCFEFGVVCEPDTPRTPGPRQNCRPRDDSPYMYKVDEYVTFLKGLKPQDPNMVIVAGIIGVPEPVVVGTNAQANPTLDPSCISASGEAFPGVRMAHFINQFPQRGTVQTICNDDLSDALGIIADLLAKVIGNPCIDGEIRTDSSQPLYLADGTPNFECQVSDVRFPGTDNEEQTIVPPCADRNNPTPTCYHLNINNDTCAGTATEAELIVERGAGSVPTGTHTQIRCVVH